MFVVFCLFFLSLCLRTSSAEVEPAPPGDLTIISLNTNYTLIWTWDQSTAESTTVTFTTQYVSRFNLKKKNPKWNTVCEDTPHRSCDLTGSNLYYLGIFMLRVRANVNGHHSKWVNKEFCPDKEAAVGPPSKIRLGSAGSALDVHITDPLTSSNGSMREHLHKMYFHLVYWEQSDERQTMMLFSNVNLVTVSDLKPWTWYCVSVQTRYDYYNKSSSFTTPQCVQTEGSIPWWQIFLYFLTSLLVCFLIMLLAIYGFHHFYNFCKMTFFPKEQLPSHIKQSLFDSPSSDNRCLVFSESESELLCDQVTVCPEPPVLVITDTPDLNLAAPPSGLEEEVSSCRQFERSSSSDSGVYSAGGNSGALQSNICPSFTDVEDQFQDCCHSEQLKMQKIDPELKIFSVIVDEGIPDMCV